MCELKNIATAEEVVDRYPQFFTKTLLNHYMRPGIRTETGFENVMIVLSERKRFINLSKLADWLEQHQVRGAA